MRTMLPLAILVLVHVPSRANADPEADLEEIDRTMPMIEQIIEMNEVLGEMRDLVRPTDFAKPVIGEPLGFQLREARKTLVKMHEVFTSAPKWAKYDKQIDAARRLLAGADAITRIVRAIDEAESSSAETKIRDLESVFKDIHIVLPQAMGAVLSGFAVTPILSAYFCVIGKAIENIAESAAKIEAATKRTNEVIRGERLRVLGDCQIDRAEYSRQAMQQIVSALRAKRRALELEIDERGHRELRAAEARCVSETGFDGRADSRLSNELVAARSQARHSWNRLDGGHGEAALAVARGRVESAARDLALARWRVEMHFLESMAVDRAIAELGAARSELERMRAGVSGAEAALARDCRALRAALQPIATFADCVRRALAGATNATPAFLREHAARYGDPAYWTGDARMAERCEKLAGTATASTIPDGLGRLHVVARNGVGEVIAPDIKFAPETTVRRASNVDFDLRPGRYQLELANYKPSIRRTVTIVAGRIQRLEVAEHGRLGFAAIDGLGQRVGIDVAIQRAGDRETMKTYTSNGKIEFRDLQAGRYDVSFDRYDAYNGFRADYKARVNIMPGRIAMAEWNPGFGRLTIDASYTPRIVIHPAGRDRVVVASGFMKERDLLPGRYDVEIEYGGKKVWTRGVVITTGKSTKLNAARGP